MILVWNNVKTFKQHIEDMKNFREAHTNRQTEQIKDMPELYLVKPPRETGLVNSLTDKKGKVIFVPIWKMSPARGTNN